MLAGAGCSQTTTNQTAELAPVEPPSAVAAALPTSIGVTSQTREIALADETSEGTIVTEVAYAAPTPSPESLAPLAGVVADANLENASTEKGDRLLAAQIPQAASEQSAVVAAVESETPAVEAAAQAVETAVAAGADPAPLAALPAPSKPAGLIALESQATSGKSGRLLVKKEEAPVVLASLGGEIKGPVKARSPELDTLIARYAKLYEVPVDLVRRVVKRESTFNPAARNGPYWGLMQIRHDTAKGMGYDGSAKGLLDAETNLTYAVKYLRGAYLTAGGNHDQAVKFYSRGYYYDAKKRGLLEVAGLNNRGKIRPARTVEARLDLPSADAPVPSPASVSASGLPGVSARGSAGIGAAVASDVTGSIAGPVGNALR